MHLSKEINNVLKVVRFPESFGCGWSWQPCSLDMNPCYYFLWSYLKDHAYCTKLHTVQWVQVETETVAEEITRDMLYDTADNYAVHLQRVHKAEDLISNTCSHKHQMQHKLSI
jgi:hypothetical protein